MILVFQRWPGVGPTSVVAGGIRQHYFRVIPHTANFEVLACCHTMKVIYTLLGRCKFLPLEWVDYKPCAQEHVFFTASLVQIAHTRRPRGKVPSWVLRFVIASLSQDPPPPTSVILYCLSIVTIDLNCHVSTARSTTLDKRYAQYLADIVLSDPELVCDWRRF